MSQLAKVRPRSGSSFTVKVVWTALTVVLAVGAVMLSTILGARQFHHPTFDAIDEQGHYDYVVYLSHGHVPRWGDPYSGATVHVLNCLGIARTAPEPCIQNTLPNRYPPDGYSYEAQQPPVGYLVYVPFLNTHASPSTALSDARRGGVAWLGIAALLLLAMAWLADMTLLQVTLLLSVCLLSPLAVRAAAVVTNDSAALAAGAASLVVVQIGRLRRSTFVIPALIVGLGVGLTKAVILFVPAAIALGGLLTERWPVNRSSIGAIWRRRGCELSLLAGAFIGTLGFPIYQEARGEIPSKVVLKALLGGQITPRPRWSTLEISVSNIFTNLDPTSTGPIYGLWNLLLFGAVLGLILNRRNSNSRALPALAVGTIVSMVVLAIACPLLDYFQGHFNFATPTRYTLAFTPLLAYLAAKSLRSGYLVLLGVVVPALAVVSTFNGHPF